MAETTMHRPIGWDNHRPLGCADCGEPWPCSGACQSCAGEGLQWNPTVDGNVVPCHECDGTGQSAGAVQPPNTAASPDSLGAGDSHTQEVREP